MEEILSKLKEAFEKDQYIPYFQPQYDNFTGLLVGAEALARLQDGELVMPPIGFISILEKYGLIGRLDTLMFEKACAFLVKCKNANAHLVPISVNLSRDDVYRDGFIEGLEEIRKKYEVDPKYLRIEITESIASEGKERAKEVVNKLHSYGYMVELDDFGSGYSTLNILKDIDYDIIKLDMGFLDEDLNGRGGTIVSSIVRMAKWLDMPVVAEGVETREQVEYMKSIGCEYTQGYYYAKPMSEEAYFTLLSDKNVAPLAPQAAKKTINAVSFWNEKSLDTLVFNSYVGPALVFYYDTKDTIEVLRVNDKYVREIGMNMSERDLVRTNILDMLDENSKAIYKDMLARAIQSGEEEECETWRTISSECCGDEKLCIRTNVILIGKSEDQCIFYASIRNITAEKKQISRGISYENYFKNVTEQANIYYWEYTVATKEMRPCFRCMRDLGLPPLVMNYPEPAIEQGIFPPDYADMYRDWHKQIAAGVKHLEAVIPLTVGRVPFHVRYDVEFDELGRPTKAYGSATLVTDQEIDTYMEKNKQ